MASIEAYREKLNNKPQPEHIAADDWEHRQQKQLFRFIDKLLDHHSPVRHLEDDRLAKIVTDAFQHFAGVRYQLLAWVVMPSHHHWLFLIDETWAERDAAERRVAGKRKQTPREVISHSIQSYTANECHKLISQSGRFWQQETYDHWVRDDDELQRIKLYIENNPVQAGLVDLPEQYRWSSAYRDASILPGASCGILPAWLSLHFSLAATPPPQLSPLDEFLNGLHGFFTAHHPINPSPLDAGLTRASGATLSWCGGDAKRLGGSQARSTGRLG